MMMGNDEQENIILGRTGNIGNGDSICNGTRLYKLVPSELIFVSQMVTENMGLSEASDRHIGFRQRNSILGFHLVIFYKQSFE